MIDRSSLCYAVPPCGRWSILTLETHGSVAASPTRSVWNHSTTSMPLRSRPSRRLKSVQLPTASLAAHRATCVPFRPTEAYRKMSRRRFSGGFGKPTSTRPFFAARRTSPYRYRLDDPALQFHAKMVSLFRLELATYDPAEVWEREIAPARLNTYMGGIFERIAAGGH